MKRSNATFTLERVEGERVTPIWSERITIKPGSGISVKLLRDGYGTGWLFWGAHRLGLFALGECLRTRATVTVDEPEMEIVGDCVGDLIEEYPATM
ncbi:MAG: hypothetical protein WC455_19135 [Dehalococcoidia bacterium]|jgi:hypothetical protein